MLKQDCGCELTDDLIFKPCRKHWQQFHDEYELNYPSKAKGEAHYEPSLGVMVVDASNQ